MSNLVEFEILRRRINPDEAVLQPEYHQTILIDDFIEIYETKLKRDRFQDSQYIAGASEVIQNLKKLMKELNTHITF